MMSRTTITLCILITLGLTLVGCGGTSPTFPPVNDELTSVRGSQDHGSNRVLWAYYDIKFDPATSQFEVTPLRSAMFNVNITRFMEPPISPVNMISLSIDGVASDILNGLIVVDVTITHPFPGLDKYRGFDVRGIFISDGETALPGNSDLIYAGVGKSRVLNCDGYTRWWNPTEFTSETIFGYEPGNLGLPVYPTAILNPYKYFCDDLDIESELTDVTLEDRGTFSLGQGTNTRRYEIQFEMDGPDIVWGFNYAIDASWEFVAPPSDYEVDDFPLTANQNEAWFIELDTSGSNLTWATGDVTGGALETEVTVHDWQSLALGGSVIDEVSEINLHSELFPSGAIGMFTSGANLISENPGEATWSLSVTSVDLVIPGPVEYDVWVEVLSASPDTYTPQIPGGNSFPVSDGALAAYWLGSVVVIEGVQADPPTVTEVIPDWGYLETAYDDVQIIGTNFTNDGLTVEFDNGTYQLPITNVVLMSPTEITVDIDCAGAELSFYDVTVTVNDPTGPGTLEGTLENGYRVGESWPQFMKNKLRNCASNATGPQSASDIVYQVPCTVATAPETLVIGPDPDDPGERLVYFGYYASSGAAFTAYRASDGSAKWTVNAPAPYAFYRVMAVAPPGVPCPNDEVGTVYAWAYPLSHAGPEKVMALSAVDGSILWEWTAPENGSWLHLERYGMVLDNGDFLLCHTSYQAGTYFLTCMDVLDGTENWQISTGFHQTPDLGLSPDGNTIYFETSGFSMRIKAYDLTETGATFKWDYDPDFASEHQSSLIVLSDGTIVNAGKFLTPPDLLQTQVLALEDMGTHAEVKWRSLLITGEQVPWSQPAEGPDGSIYLGIGYPTAAWGPSTLYRLNPDDGTIMNQSDPLPGLEPRSGLAVDHEGNVYAGADGHIYALSQDCSYLWQIDGGRFTDAALDVDGSLFAADVTNGELYRIQSE